MPSPAASAVLVKCVSQEKSVQVADNIKSFITELTGNEYAANVSSMQAMLEQYEEVSGTVSLMLSGIAAILLLLFCLPKKRLSRVAGIIFLICYAVYFYMIW